VKFGGNQSGKIIGIGTIGNSSISINNVWLVDGLEHNLLSISQFCDNGYDVMFGKTNCTIINKDDNSIVDDYSRWTWVKFLRSKDNAYDVFSNFCTQIQSEKEMQNLKVRSDHGGEFENEPFETFCEKHGIIHEFSSPRTQHQNGVVERKNRTLQEMARTMIHENNLAKHF